MHPADILIPIGSSLGDRVANYKLATTLLTEKVGPITKAANLYASAPIGKATELFLNTAVICRTNLAPEVAMNNLLSIEQEMGRTREVRWGDRLIDLDIVLWREASGAQLVLATPTLKVPHPESLNRDFVLVPAAEIAPDWVHPTAQIDLSTVVREKKFSLPLWR